MKRFSYKIKSLERGLRTEKENPRSNGFLITCNGMVARDGVLQAIDELTRMDTSLITDGFPYPQLYTSTKSIIACGYTKIYEYVDGSWVLQAEVNGCAPWRVLQFTDFIYLTNELVAVTKDPDTGLFTESTELSAIAACNYNNQVVLGSANCPSCTSTGYCSGQP